MKTLPTLTALAMIAGLSPALAQTVDDGTVPTDEAVVVQDETAGTDITDGQETATDDSEDATEDGDDGLFSRFIPDGLAKYFSDEETDDYQARLDAAESPQERNAVRKELQRENQARHLEEAQSVRDEKRVEKGFFEALSDDVNAIASGDLANRPTRDDRGGNAHANGSGRDKDRGNRGGGNRGGGNRGGGNGKGRG